MIRVTVLSALIIFSDDAKFRGDANISEDRIRIKRTLTDWRSRLQKTNLVQARKTCEVMHLSKKNQLHRYRLADIWLHYV